MLELQGKMETIKVGTNSVEVTTKGNEIHVFDALFNYKQA